MNYKIVTDSSADTLSYEGISFASAPLKIITDNKEYIDDESLDVEAMLSELKTYKGKSHTSCPSTGDYLTAFEGAENIFCITITSGLSGSFNAASTAAKMFLDEHPECNIHVIDSLSTGPENYLLIRKLAELCGEGLDFNTVKEKITEYHNHTRLIFALESMHNLANNGRVSHLVAKMAGLLGIRAVGRASDVGTLEMTGKSRGAAATVKDIFTNMKAEGYSGGRVRIHHAVNPDAAENLKNKIKGEFPDADVTVDTAGGLCSFYAESGGLLIGFEI